jgi:hypothetical protein
MIERRDRQLRIHPDAANSAWMPPHDAVRVVAAGYGSHDRILSLGAGQVKMDCTGMPPLPRNNESCRGADDTDFGRRSLGDGRKWDAGACSS